jgi:hypothetical protein
MMRCVIPSAISAPSPNSVPTLRLFANMKPNLSLWRSWRRDQLFDRGKDDGKFFVVFLLETFDLALTTLARRVGRVYAQQSCHEGQRGCLSRNQVRKVNGSRIRTTTGWPCLRAGANRQFCTAYIASSANEEAVAIMGRMSLVAPSAVTLNSTRA